MHSSNHFCSMDIIAKILLIGRHKTYFTSSIRGVPGAAGHTSFAFGIIPVVQVRPQAMQFACLGSTVVTSDEGRFVVTNH